MEIYQKYETGIDTYTKADTQPKYPAQIKQDEGGHSSQIKENRGARDRQ